MPLGREKWQEERSGSKREGWFSVAFSPFTRVVFSALTEKTKAPRDFDRESQEVSPPPSVHAHVADPSAEPALLVVAASLGVWRWMVMLG